MRIVIEVGNAPQLVVDRLVAFFAAFVALWEWNFPIFVEEGEKEAANGEG